VLSREEKETDCCTFELDRQGNIIDYRKREEKECCRRCDKPEKGPSNLSDS
jgi:hypothetical protein